MLNNKFGYSEKIPENIREIFMWLCQDLASLHDKWDFYLDLFSSKENTEILSELALSSFQIIEESLRNDITLAICRLSDPSKSQKGERNLTIQTLVDELDNLECTKELLNDFLLACYPVRQLRNKHVGHNDLKTKIMPHDNPLPGIGKSDIDRIVCEAEKLLNSIFQYFEVNSELAFQKPIQIGGAEDLVNWLKLAKEHQKKIRFK